MKRIELKNWRFRIPCLQVDKEVTLPHTWNVDEDEKVQLYRGKALYACTVHMECAAEQKFVLYFGCAYHTARVWVNGALAGAHSGSGYTPFQLDVTAYITAGENRIQVEVSNRKCKKMLPYLHHFDWADDGGLTRDVALTVYDPDDFTDMAVTYQVEAIHGDTCRATVYVQADGTPQSARLKILDFQTQQAIFCKSVWMDGGISVALEDLKLWDTHTPQLYTVVLEGAQSTVSRRIGFRTIRVQGAKVLLNGKEIYLKGCEWMPGSDPHYGMAEPMEISEKYLTLLKAAGCVFTRFHWQQDSTLFDWCDENGLLVQEEIPYWGNPKKPGPEQLALAKGQVDDMVRYHGHHPSIICWGVGNELGGRTKQAIQYVASMYGYCKSKDPSRLVNYVSNTLPMKKRRFEQADDATLHGDIAMWNDYLGLWLKSKDVTRDVVGTYKQCGDMPCVISEFGLCEPFFSGGDQRRSEILQSRVALYQTLPNVVGYVWFSLNDYRTQCGEDGKGRMRRRIHGSTDLYGNTKPSYEILKEL